ncbi:hypothetical protein BH11PLA1_BH11PLA1_20570 [soil metagenome]
MNIQNAGGGAGHDVGGLRPRREGKVPVAIVGPTGYTGLELMEMLAGHPRMRVAMLATARKLERPVSIVEEFPRLAGRLGDGDGVMRMIDYEAIAAGARLAFLCMPHEAAMVHAPELLKRGVKVVDLSAAYRLKDAGVYERFYGHAHTDTANLKHAVYGLPELFREEIRGARLVANPGCYPTAAALALWPLVKAGLVRPETIVINAASGATGAGREAKAHLTLVEAGDNFSAYGIGVHRHQPEIEQTLQFGLEAGKKGGRVGVLFVPHLLPIARGILETIICDVRGEGVTTEMVQGCLREFYGKSESAGGGNVLKNGEGNGLEFNMSRSPAGGTPAPLVQAGRGLVVVRDEAPTLRDVQRTAMVHVNARVVGGDGGEGGGGSGGARRVVVVAAIDNLSKGASAQAVQNGNLMMGMGELDGIL